MEERVYPLTHYAVVRADLPTGHQLAQLAHAIGESLSERHPEGTYAIVLAAPDIPGLLRVRDALERAGIPHKLICEPDFNNAPTAIGLTPTRDRRSVRKVLGRLPLLK